MAEEKKKSGKGKGGKAPARRKAVPAGKAEPEPKSPVDRPAKREPAAAAGKPVGKSKPPPGKTGSAAGNAGKKAKAPATKPARKKPAAAGRKSAAKRKPPEPGKTGSPAANTSRKSAKKPPAPARATPAATPARSSRAVLRQHQAGVALIVASAAGIAWVGDRFGPDPLPSMLHWAGRAAVQGVSAALIAFFLWVLLSRRHAVSYVLVLGFATALLLAYDAATAWRLDRTRVAADRILVVLEARQRTVESLTPEEQANPYVEAYIAMREIYWELYTRSDDQMSRYRAYYGNFTAGGSFLDTARLATKKDLWRSIRQIQSLEKRLLRVETSPPDLTDLLLTVDLLNIDKATRRAYAADLHATRDALVAATAALTARERQSLAATRQSLEVLLEVEGRYRIVSGNIVFDDPNDAARFAGKAGDEDGS